MADKYKPYILKSRKEVQLPSHHQLRTFVVKLPNGKFGILTLRILRNKPRKTKKAITKIRMPQRKPQNLEDIHLHS